MKKYILLLIAGILFVRLCLGQEVLPLYKTVPGNFDNLKDHKERSDTDKTGAVRLTNVTVPDITVYHPDKTNNKHTAIIICPGGGYTHLAFSAEGTDIAKTLIKWGVTAIVLKYRLPNDSVMSNKAYAPFQDAQKALQLTRINAHQWEVDKDKIGIMGFSAGGHLASAIATHFNHPFIDDKENVSLRPDFCILGYPLITLDPRYTNKKGTGVLTGSHPDTLVIKLLSNELHVAKNTPPTFLVLASNDHSVNPLNSMMYAEMLLKNHVPFELHLYEKGGHGFGGNTKLVGDDWLKRLKHWLENNHYL